MKKVLIVTSVASMVDQFLIPNISALQEMNFEVTVSCNFKFGSSCSNEKINELKEKLKLMNVKFFNVDFPRSPLSKNISCAYSKLKDIIIKGNYDIVHCHAPVSGILTRLACRKLRKNGLKVIYTAHGFHFFKGAPVKNWLMYYPIEKTCSKFTDVLITINKEDYALAKSKMKAQKIEYVQGVGIDVNKFSNTAVDKTAKRKELQISDENTMLLSVGELNKNKNHEVVIKAISMINNKNIHYFIAGKGSNDEYLISLAKSIGLENNVHLLGFRTDVNQLYSCADMFVFPSYREGLSVSLMEAMANGLPCAVSKIRGNTDLIDEKGGSFFNPSSVEECKEALDLILKNNSNSMSEYNKEKIKQFGINTVNKKMAEIYKEICDG